VSGGTVALRLNQQTPVKPTSCYKWWHRFARVITGFLHRAGPESRRFQGVNDHRLFC